MEELESIDIGTVKKFTLDGDEYIAKVIKVYDEDSITVVFKYGGEFRKWTCRLSGIDTPELRNCSPFEKIARKKARDFLKSIIPESSDLYLISIVDSLCIYNCS